MSDHTIQAFSKGTYNLGDDENIPLDAAQSSYNWLTQDGRIKLIPGSYLTGAQGGPGYVTGEHFGYKIDGTKVHYQKISTKIQYLNGTTWTDLITGLTANSEYTFSNYSSLAGSFTYVTGIDGIWKIINAGPWAINVTSATKNFKGYSFIDKGRMILWNRPTDKTGLYGSWIDRQNSTVYTTVTGEVTGASGTLAFKAGGATRSCFGVTITVTGTGEVFSDGFLGILTGSLGHTGTINYATGAYVLTTGGGVGTGTYQWEDSNIKGVTDFSLTSPTRVAGEGFQFPQDVGGDAILNVNIGIDGAYYSMKSQSAYKLVIGAADTSTDTTNEVYRRDLGLPNFRASTSSSKGIIFLNTAQPTKPQLTILRRNDIGTDIEPYQMFPQFDFSQYNFSNCCVDTYDRYVIIACKKLDSAYNNVILLGDLISGTIEETRYSARCFAKDLGSLYAGSAITESTFLLYNGFDDDGLAIENEWISKGEQYGNLQIAETLKKFKKIRIKGSIDPDQTLKVYLSYDDAGFELVGTILGSGSYTDFTNPQSIGGNIVGTTQIGGSDTSIAYPFFAELKVKTPKFRKRTLRLVAGAIGYVSVDSIMDWNISKFEGRIPKRFRVKQDVSLDGTQVDQ